MRGFWGKAGFGLAAFWLAASTPAHAMECWNSQKAAAARVRDLQSRLMVASMRCGAMKIDIIPAYNAFVSINRSTIQAANDLIKAQFAAEYGEQSQAEYDRFTTVLANAYGGDTTSVEACAKMVGFAAEAVAAQGNAQSLLTLAEKMGPAPELPGGTCPMTFTAVGQP
jgi:hypothetical protein